MVQILKLKCETVKNRLNRADVSVKAQQKEEMNFKYLFSHEEVDERAGQRKSSVGL